MTPTWKAEVRTEQEERWGVWLASTEGKAVLRGDYLNANQRARAIALAFAESESALARKDEREACIKACCEICANGDQAVKTDAGWCHAGAMPEEYVFCGAEAIRERATRPERKEG